MNLYILKRLDKVGWDEVRGVVVRAKSIDHARELVAADPCAEGAECWRDDSRSSCELLPVTGEAGAILWDVKHG